MKVQNIIIYGFLLTISSWSLGQQSNTSNIHFTVKPNKCIALHKGQMCYQKLQFHWDIPQAGDFCLYHIQRDLELVCWKDQEQTHFDYQFTANVDQDYQLIDRRTRQPLAEVSVVVAWVYKTKRRNIDNWRLF